MLLPPFHPSVFSSISLCVFTKKNTLTEIISFSDGRSNKNYLAAHDWPTTARRIAIIMNMARKPMTAEMLSWYRVLQRTDSRYCDVSVVSDFLSMSCLNDAL